ncbi:MAG: hypothetical protein LBB53_04980 [Prevotellaceae bacterium]|jgi:phosphatidylglycerophosphatase A|nr:hypothetical protein [Prevotellaceae bacterium]
MKKLVLFFAAAIIAVSFAACGNATKTTEGNDSTEVVAEEVVAEAVAVDSADVDSTDVETTVETPAE